jgi:cell division protein FtsX
MPCILLRQNRTWKGAQAGGSRTRPPDINIVSDFPLARRPVRQLFTVTDSITMMIMIIIIIMMMMIVLVVHRAQYL